MNYFHSHVRYKIRFARYRTSTRKSYKNSCQNSSFGLSESPYVLHFKSIRSWSRTVKFGNIKSPHSGCIGSQVDIMYLWNSWTNTVYTRSTAILPTLPCARRILRFYGVLNRYATGILYTSPNSEVCSDFLYLGHKLPVDMGEAG